MVKIARYLFTLALVLVMLAPIAYVGWFFGWFFHQKGLVQVWYWFEGMVAFCVFGSFMFVVGNVCDTGAERLNRGLGNKRGSWAEWWVNLVASGVVLVIALGFICITIIGLLQLYGPCGR